MAGGRPGAITSTPQRLWGTLVRGCGRPLPPPVGLFPGLSSEPRHKPLPRYQRFSVTFRIYTAQICGAAASTSLLTLSALLGHRPGRLRHAAPLQATAPLAKPPPQASSVPFVKKSIYLPAFEAPFKSNSDTDLFLLEHDRLLALWLCQQQAGGWWPQISLPLT